MPFIATCVDAVGTVFWDRPGWHDEVSIQHPHVQAPKDFLAGLPGFVLVHTGGYLRIPAMPSAWQFTYGVGTNHHGVKVFSHTVRFSIQWIAWVTQKIQDADVGGIYLL